MVAANVNILKTKPFENIKNLNLQYLNDDLEFKKTNFNTSEAFNFSLYDALSEFNDFSANNYSYFFLGKKDLFSNWLTINTKENSISGYITPLKFTLEGEVSYLKFDSNNITNIENKLSEYNSILTVENETTLRTINISLDDAKNISDFIFAIDIIENTNKCYIKHLYKGLTFYLTVTDTEEFIFTTDNYENSGKFNYIISDNLIIFYIVKNGIVKSICVDGNTLIFKENNDLCPFINDNNKLYVSVCEFLLDKSDIDSFINSTWLSYEEQNLGTINKSKSQYNIETQCLYHLQYNNIDSNFTTTLNIIPLKNIVSPQNNIIRGNYLNSTDENIPNVDFREYTTLETGTNQEFGTNTITLNYIYYDKEYTIQPGHSLIFNTESNNNKLTESLQSSLYPFKTLNINDTNFVKNGAFGSTIPFLADKFKKLQKNSQFSNNGRYLYTWLYRSPSVPYGIWLDRYYYPNIISKKNALLGKINLDPASFKDIIDKDYIQVDDTLSTFIGNSPYFDKQSDSVIEPDTQYEYFRIGEYEVNTVLDTIKDNKEYSIDKYKNTIKINSLNNKNSGEFDLTFDMYLSPNKQYGLELFGNSNNNGLSIRNQKDITPFIYLFDNIYENEILNHSYIHLLNEDYKEIKTIDLEFLYSGAGEIKQLAFNKVFEDLVVLTEKHIFIIGFDLTIKEKFDINSLFGDTLVINSLYISNNKIYFIINNKRIMYINLKDINPQIYELKKFIPGSSILVQDINTNKIYPISNNEEFGTYIITQDDKEVFRINNSEDLPFGLLPNTYVYKISDISFDCNYWFYTNNFDNENGELKTLYIDNESTVFAFNYTKIVNRKESASLLYGLKEVEPNMLYYIEDINLDEYRLANNIDMRNIVFASYAKLLDISTDDQDNLAILKYAANKKDIELQIYNNAKRLIYQTNLSKIYTNVFGLDSFKNSNSISYFTLNGTIKNEDDTIEYHAITIENGIVNSTILPISVSSANDNICNYNKFITESYDNTLDFILSLPKSTLITDKFIYSYNLDNIVSGWYNIRIIIDLNKGVYEVYINNKLIDNPIFFNIDNYTYNFKNVFNYSFILGSTVYRNGLTLDNFLETDNRYIGKNLNIKNFCIYNKILSDFEYQALMLKLSGITPLVITLPCGQRNNLEEIIRYFKYNPPANISNTIRINIKNSNIVDYNEQQKLSLDILKKINEELACPLTIKEINFIS